MSTEIVLRGVKEACKSHYDFGINTRDRSLQDALCNQKKRSGLHTDTCIPAKIIQRNYLYLLMSHISLVISFVCSWKEGRADQRSQGLGLNKHQDYGSKNRGRVREERNFD